MSKIISAFSSKTMASLFQNYLTEKGHNVLSVDSGKDLLLHALTDSPDFIVSELSLPQIDGFNISRIIKNSREMSSTKVILCTLEKDSVRQYWADISSCDLLYQLKDNDISTLDDELTRLANSCENKPAAIDTGRKLNLGATGVAENDLLPFIINSYDRNFFSLHTIKSAFENSRDFNFDVLFSQLSKSVMSVINYDALGIIINSSPIRTYFSYSKELSGYEREDFERICQADFEEKAISVKRFEWKKSLNQVMEKDGITGQNAIKSSESFPSEPSETLSFTMTIGCGRLEAFNTRTTDRLSFVLDTYTHLYHQAIKYNHLAEAEENIEKAFARFVPQRVIDDVISGTAHDTNNAGEKRKVAVSMTDIRSFTSISEINEPEKVVEFLNTFFTKMGAIIKRHGGIIDKFMGDCIMALFGAPESYEDNGARAARAAIEMHQAIKDMDVPLNMPAGMTFSIGTGIHYGDMIVGSLGSEDKKEYTVIGDNVNIASRLEGLTKLYGAPIIISDAVREDFGNEVPARHMDNVKVKGKSVAIPIYALYPDGLTESESFYENYKKGLNQYILGNFTIAVEYFEKALALNQKDKASALMIERCHEFKQNQPEKWDGAVMLTTK